MNMKKLFLMLAMGAVCAHLAVDAAAQIRRYDPATGGSSQVGGQPGALPQNQSLQQPSRAPAVQQSGQQQQVAADPTPEQAAATLVQSFPLGSAAVFVDAATEMNAGKMSELLKVRDLRGQGMLVEFFRRDEDFDMKTFDHKAFQENVIEMVKMLPQSVVGEIPEGDDMIGFPAFTYDHDNEMAKENKVTAFPAIVYQAVPDGERKVFPISAGIDNFMKAVNDRRRELREKR